MGLIMTTTVDLGLNVTRNNEPDTTFVISKSIQHDMKLHQFHKLQGGYNWGIGYSLLTQML